MKLYLMQNCHGLLKIGVSDDPVGRLVRLQQQFKCAMTLVAVLEGGATHEESFHAKLRRFRRIGEWFSGTDRAREVASELFKLSPNFTWPYPYERQAAQQWVTAAATIYDRRYWDRFRRSVIQSLKSGLQNAHLDADECANLDALIGMSLDHAFNDVGYMVITDKKGHRVAIHGATDEPIPRYTSDRRLAARLLDPLGKIHVERLEGSRTKEAIAYCIAVLSEMWGIGVRQRRFPVDDLKGPFSQTPQERANPMSRNRHRNRW